MAEIVLANRNFEPISELNYGDYGLLDVVATLTRAIKENKRIALYADYDVDGTMSCVSWIWFFRAIGFENFTHYIPCRFKEGYGLNLKAMENLIHTEKAELIITMDTGITANAEAKYCKEHNVDFICTDHHKIQPDKMPDCLILNPKQHPDPSYQELCGCGITFVVLRKLASQFDVPSSVWTDILALAGMATICDVVPLNPVNHRLAKLGVAALMRSERPVLKQLREASAVEKLDEMDVGFRLGPRINAVGRLEHADVVVQAFINEDPSELIGFMNRCNDERKKIQKDIVKEATEQAALYPDDNILFLGGNWHPGVVGIAASRLAEDFWRPTWLFSRSAEKCKGSARSIAGFDVTSAMEEIASLFEKFGGHKAAAGYSFEPENETRIRSELNLVAQRIREDQPKLWESQISYDCSLPLELLSLDLVSHLEGLKPFGHQFEAPKFRIECEPTDVTYYKDRDTFEPKHTAITIKLPHGPTQKILFFNQVHKDIESRSRYSFLVTASRNFFRGNHNLSLIGEDFQIL